MANSKFEVESVLPNTDNQIRLFCIDENGLEHIIPLPGWIVSISQDKGTYHLSPAMPDLATQYPHVLLAMNGYWYDPVTNDLMFTKSTDYNNWKGSL